MQDRTLTEIIGAANNNQEARTKTTLYEAVTQRPEVKREYRLWLQTSKGTSHHIQYSSILDILAIEPNMISLACTHGAFMITCKNFNLPELEIALHDEKVYRLQPFNAKLFDQPEQGEGIITNILFQETRPSKPIITETAAEAPAAEAIN